MNEKSGAFQSRILAICLSIVITLVVTGCAGGEGRYPADPQQTKELSIDAIKAQAYGGETAFDEIALRRAAQGSDDYQQIKQLVNTENAAREAERLSWFCSQAGNEDLCEAREPTSQELKSVARERGACRISMEPSGRWIQTKNRKWRRVLNDSKRADEPNEYACFAELGMSSRAYTESRAEDTSWSVEKNYNEVQNGINWSAAEVDAWYNLSQGARLIPLSWLKALERADAKDKFLAPQNRAQFQYVERSLLWPNAENAALPLGFTVDRSNRERRFSTHTKSSISTGEEWVGFNCAACHTSQFTYEGSTFLVHGGPAMSDFMSFVNGITDSLKATQNDESKFQRFANSIFGSDPNGAQSEDLKSRLRELTDYRKSIEQKNGNIGNAHYGFGRLDAVGHILNKVSLVADGNTEANWPSDAPVSYPHIWNASQQSLLQWNGVASNSPNPINIRGRETDIGALGRNVGEVTGVWADMKVRKSRRNSLSVQSSANVENLIQLERILKKIPSPTWPWPDEIDTKKSAAGQQLYDKYCLSCHSVVRPDDLTTKMPERAIGSNEPKIVMNWLHDVGTDVWMACNSYQFGVRRDEFGQRMKTPDHELGTTMLTKVVESSILNQWTAIARQLIKDLFARGDSSGPSAERALGLLSEKEHKKQECLADSKIGKAKQETYQELVKRAATEPSRQLRRKIEEAKAELERYAQLRYKARPLNGIWATAPYLHNGSVPNLRALLLPAKPNNQISTGGGPTNKQSHRPDCFVTGSIEFDKENVGLVASECGSGSDDVNLNRFEIRTEIPGNSNGGHNYPRIPLTQEERDALLEYLKTL